MLMEFIRCSASNSAFFGMFMECPWGVQPARLHSMWVGPNMSVSGWYKKVFPTFSKRLKGAVSKDFSGGLQAPLSYIRLEFPYCFPNTFHFTYVAVYMVPHKHFCLFQACAMDISSK